MITMRPVIPFIGAFALVSLLAPSASFASSAGPNFIYGTLKSYKDPKIAVPRSAPKVRTQNLSGNVDPGAHRWAVTFVTGNGESIPGPASRSVQTDTGKSVVRLTKLPLGPRDANIVSRRVYRTAVADGSLHLVTTIQDDTTRNFTDNLADASLGGAPPGPTVITTSSGDVTVRVTSNTKLDNETANGETPAIGDSVAASVKWEHGVPAVQRLEYATEPFGFHRQGFSGIFVRRTGDCSAGTLTLHGTGSQSKRQWTLATDGATTWKFHGTRMGCPVLMNRGERLKVSGVHFTDGSWHAKIVNQNP